MRHRPPAPFAHPLPSQVRAGALLSTALTHVFIKLIELGQSPGSKALSYLIPIPDSPSREPTLSQFFPRSLLSTDLG